MPGSLYNIYIGNVNIEFKFNLFGIIKFYLLSLNGLTSDIHAFLSNFFCTFGYKSFGMLNKCTTDKERT